MEDKLKEEFMELGGKEWFHESNLDSYIQLAMGMITGGVDMDDAIEYLSEAYSIVADEFGG